MARRWRARRFSGPPSRNRFDSKAPAGAAAGILAYGLSRTGDAYGDIHAIEGGE